MAYVVMRVLRKKYLQVRSGLTLNGLMVRTRITITTIALVVLLERSENVCRAGTVSVVIYLSFRLRSRWWVAFRRKFARPSPAKRFCLRQIRLREAPTRLRGFPRK